MNIVLKTITWLCLALSLAIPQSSLARSPQNITDWYIKDFHSKIVVNTDASLTITENIIADAGNLPDKHGIFRILPTSYYISQEKKVRTPVSLIEIVDSHGQPYKYQEIKNTSDDTITWKIGDANKTVRGENTYQITYRVDNTIRFGNQDFDEFYWNLNGNFWNIETDNFVADIVFPDGINRTNTEIHQYTGLVGLRNIDASKYQWASNNTLRFSSTRTLYTKEGITASITFPKGIITQPSPDPFEPYRDALEAGILWLILPILIFLVSFAIWQKHGKDIAPNRSVAPEFDIPENLSPMKMGAFYKNGNLSTKHISATIIGLAVKGILKIEEVGTKGPLGINIKDTSISFIGDATKLEKLSPEEKTAIAYVFGKAKATDLAKGEEIMLSSLKNQFYKHANAMKIDVRQDLYRDGLFSTIGDRLHSSMITIGVLGVFLIYFLATWLVAHGIYTLIAWVLSSAIILLFGILMTKRTEKGAELLWKVKGFEMYMKTAEKYRQQFNEKENIFERFLPYAMIFGITGLWIKKMREIYGEEYFARYHPVWYVGHHGSFNIDDFSSQLNSISSSMASTMASSPSSSGSGGGGFSGGGGGGGGGGGW